MPTDAGNYIEPEQPKGKYPQGEIHPRKRMAMENGQPKVSINPK